MWEPSKTGFWDGEASGIDDSKGDGTMSNSSSKSYPTEAGGIPVYIVGKKEQPASLRLIKGPEAPKTYALELPETVIGRGEDAHIAVESPSVSRRHARLVRVDKAFTVEDLGSANGVYVNGTRHDGADLANGDTVQIGDALFVFQAGT